MLRALSIYTLSALLAMIILAGCANQPGANNSKGADWQLEMPPKPAPAFFTSYDIEKTSDGRWALKMFGFEGEDEIGRFVFGDVNVFVETAKSADGKNTSAEATYFRSNKATGKQLYFYVLTNPLRGRYSDWSGADEFRVNVTSMNSFDLSLKTSITDESEGHIETATIIPAGKSIDLRFAIDELKSRGIDVSKLKRINFEVDDKMMPDITATLQFDDLTIIASDKAWLENAKVSAEKESDRQVGLLVNEEKAPYIPRLTDNPATISEIESRFKPGPIDGVAKCDVLVVGGGMAGCSAAIAASRAGADVILVESYGFLGGMATAGMVFPFMSSRAGDEQIIEGIFLEIYERLAAEGLARRDKLEPGIIWFDKEGLKYALQEMCVEAGVKLMLYTWADKPLQAVAGGKGAQVEGAMVSNKTGRIAIAAKITIDCTGDGDIAARAGCPYEQGRGYDPYTQSATMFFRMGNVDFSKAFTAQNQRLLRTENMIPAEYMFADKFKQAKANGDLDPDLPINVVYFEKTLSPGVVSINATRAFKIDPTKDADLTYAEVETRRQVEQMSKFLRKYIPGFENSFLQESAINLGIRESRRILGEYQLTGRDVLSARKFDDVIARGAFGIDIHCADFSGCGVVGLELEEGASYDIPYGVLVPKEVDGILVAGRCISATHVALGSARIMPVASATGQAAGAAAALCVKNGVQPRGLDVKELQDLLISQHANLGM